MTLGAFDYSRSATYTKTMALVSSDMPRCTQGGRSDGCATRGSVDAQIEKNGYFGQKSIGDHRASVLGSGLMIASRIQQVLTLVYPHICWENNCVYFVEFSRGGLGHSGGVEGGGEKL